MIAVLTITPDEPARGSITALEADGKLVDIEVHEQGFILALRREIVTNADNRVEIGEVEGLDVVIHDFPNHLVFYFQRADGHLVVSFS